jgi:type IV pilus assembly protein PilW
MSARLRSRAGAGRRAVRGLTLVELMVALAAGLLVTLAGAATYLLARQGFSTNSDQMDNLDSGRVAIDLLSRNLRMAGAPAFNPGQVTAGTVYGLPGGLMPLSGVEGGAGPDSITVRYWSDQPYNAARLSGADCLGQSVGVNTVVNEFSIASGDLVCKGNGAGAGATPLPVAAQVVDMQITYGVAPSADAGSATQFMNATEVNTAAAWARVRSVDLCLEVVAANTRPGMGATAGLNCRGTAFANDNRVHRIFRTTVNVRNGTAGNIFPNNAMP